MYHQIVNGRYDWKTKTHSILEGYEPIIIHPGKYQYNKLSPYSLKTQEGYYIENVWQFSKIYQRVYDISTYSYVEGYRGKVNVWKHGTETHIDSTGTPTTKYWEWRQKGFENQFAVRYANGFQHKNECVGSYIQKDDGWYYLIDYIEARKRIYCQLYIDILSNGNTNTIEAIKQYQELKKG